MTSASPTPSVRPMVIQRRAIRLRYRGPLSLEGGPFVVRPLRRRHPGRPSGSCQWPSFKSQPRAMTRRFSSSLKRHHTSSLGEMVSSARGQALEQSTKRTRPGQRGQNGRRFAKVKSGPLAAIIRWRSTSPTASQIRHCHLILRLPLTKEARSAPMDHRTRKRPMFRTSACCTSRAFSSSET